MSTKRLATDAVLVALYAVLAAFVSVKAGNMRITFASLPVVVCALLYGPGDACAVAALGEFMNQMLGYGFTVTTPLWLIPPALRALAIGLAAASEAKRGGALERSAVRFSLVCALAAVLTTAANTAVIWIDSVIMGYYTEAVVFGAFSVRLVTGLVTAAAVATAAIPVVMALRKSGFGRTPAPQADN